MSRRKLVTTLLACAALSAAAGSRLVGGTRSASLARPARAEPRAAPSAAEEAVLLSARTVDAARVEPVAPRAAPAAADTDAAYLAGTLRAWSGASFRDVRLRLRRVGEDAPLSKRIVLRPGADGRFEAGPIPAATYGIDLFTIGWPFESATRLGEVALVPGRSSPLVLDVAAHLPTPLVVRVAGARPGERLGAWAARAADPRQSCASLEADADGIVVVPAVPPGEIVVVIEAQDRNATFLAPGLHRVAAGTLVVVDVALDLVEGEVLVLNAETGDPFAGRIELAPEAPVAGGWVPGAATDARTGTDGRLRVALAPGTYRVCAGFGPHDREQAPEIAWPPPAGTTFHVPPVNEIAPCYGF